MMKKLASVLVLMLVAAGAAAQESRPAPGERPRTAAPPSGAMPALMQEIGLDQKLNEQLPLSLRFRDEQGRDVALGDYFGERPVILALVYYECPMLCTQVLNGLTGALKVMNLEVGRDFDVVAVSFDPDETPELARAKKAAYVERYGREASAPGWHFLTGHEREISALTRAVGFRYAYNADVDQYAHASGVMVLTPEGRLSHYFYGIEYPPRDLRLAIVESSERRIGSPVDQLLLACFHYDPASGKYSLAIMRLIRVAGVVTLVAIGGTIVLLRRRDRQGPRPGSPRA